MTDASPIPETPVDAALVPAVEPAVEPAEMELPPVTVTSLDEYRLDPTPDKLNKVVNTLEPVIGYHLSVRNLAQSPQMRTQARVIAAKAVQSYDPASGAKLSSWVGTQMQRLNRLSRMSSSGFKLPDRVYTDAQNLRAAEAEFLAEHDRTPDVKELADAARMPVSRVATVRRSLRRSVPSATFGDSLPSGLTTEQDPMVDEAVDYVYQDSDKVDRAILEMKTGYGGKFDGGMDSTQIAQQLNIDPSQVSRRMARLTFRLLKQQDELHQAYGGQPTA